MLKWKLIVLIDISYWHFYFIYMMYIYIFLNIWCVLVGFQPHLKRRSRARRSRRRRKPRPRSLSRSPPQHLRLRSKAARRPLPPKQQRFPPRTRRPLPSVQSQSRPRKLQRLQVKALQNPRKPVRRLRSPHPPTLRVPSTSRERWESPSPTLPFPRSSRNQATGHQRASPPESPRPRVPPLPLLAPATLHRDLATQLLQRRPRPPCRRHPTTRWGRTSGDHWRTSCIRGEDLTLRIPFLKEPHNANLYFLVFYNNTLSMTSVIIQKWEKVCILLC